MVTKHCCWGTCDSDSRQKNKEHMKCVTCIPFVKPHIDKGKCERWTGEQMNLTSAKLTSTHTFVLR